MDWPVILDTARLVLRPWRPTDAEALFAYASDPEVGPRAGWLPHQSVDESAQVIRDILDVPFTWAITLRDGSGPDQAVGSISLMVGEQSDLAIGDDQAEIGYWIARPLWGKGLMTEAVREVMRFAFCDLGLVALWSGHAASNDQSRRVQEKVGLKRQRSIRNRPRRLIGDRMTEDVNWITREEWKELQDTRALAEAADYARQDVPAGNLTSLPRIARIRSGGQTGADRGALDAARALGTPICGWCPPGGLAEDLPTAPGLLARYPELEETPDDGYAQRTAYNVRDSHATLIVAPAGFGPHSGTGLTERLARQMGRPCMVVRSLTQVADARAWLEGLGYGLTLNVAGPRESQTPGTYALTREVVRLLLATD